MIPRSALSRPFVVTSFLLAVTIFPAQAKAAPHKSAREQYNMLADEHNLAREGVQPWYLKADITIFDDAAKPTDAGTIEWYFAGPKNNLLIFKLKNLHQKILMSNGNRYRDGDSAILPYAAKYGILRLITPMWMDHPGDMLELEDSKAGDIPLKCIEVLNDTKIVHTKEPRSNFCLDQTATHLLMTQSLDISFLYNKLKTFQGSEVATELTIVSEKKKMATLHVTELTSITPDIKFFTPSATAQRTLFSADDLQGADVYLRWRSFIMPKSSNLPEDQQSGNVIIAMRVKHDGSMEDVRADWASDPTLIPSAIAAMKNSYFIGPRLPAGVDSVENYVPLHYQR